MSEPMLEVKDLVAGYGASTVLDGLEFSMGVEVVAMLGRNGMGKTTLCNVSWVSSPRRGARSASKERMSSGCRPRRSARRDRLRTSGAHDSSRR